MNNVKQRPGRNSPQWQLREVLVVNGLLLSSADVRYSHDLGRRWASSEVEWLEG